MFSLLPQSFYQRVALNAQTYYHTVLFNNKQKDMITK